MERQAGQPASAIKRFSSVSIARMGEKRRGLSVRQIFYTI